MRRIGKGFGILGEPFAGEYESLKSLEKIFGSEIKFQKKMLINSELSSINAYPVKHYDVFDVDSDGEYPTYAKKKDSEDRFAAGYWCLKFKEKWQSSFCPRIKTIIEHPNQGPFKTKMEMEYTIKIENSKDNE